MSNDMSVLRPAKPLALAISPRVPTDRTPAPPSLRGFAPELYKHTADASTLKFRKETLTLLLLIIAQGQGGQGSVVRGTGGGTPPALRREPG